MKNPIKTLEIKNFKTIKDSKNINCKRINIFIGKPNVGKSNILEAISLLGATYSNARNKFLSDFICYENKNNQFFITTHSPFILNTIIENASLKDVAVFVTDYEKYQTKIKPLSEKEIKNMLDYGSDIFFNLK